jgi:hypothetical protein
VPAGTLYDPVPVGTPKSLRNALMPKTFPGSEYSMPTTTELNYATISLGSLHQLKRPPEQLESRGRPSGSRTALSKDFYPRATSPRHQVSRSRPLGHRAPFPCYRGPSSRAGRLRLWSRSACSGACFGIRAKFYESTPALINLIPTCGRLGFGVMFCPVSLLVTIPQPVFRCPRDRGTMPCQLRTGQSGSHLENPHPVQRQAGH